jgi:hypothetical protein
VLAVRSNHVYLGTPLVPIIQREFYDKKAYKYLVHFGGGSSALRIVGASISKALLRRDFRGDVCWMREVGCPDMPTHAVNY